MGKIGQDQDGWIGTRFRLDPEAGLFIPTFPNLSIFSPSSI
jgi:hypothetical protein